MKKFLIYLLSFLICFICFALIYNPQKYIKVCYQGILLWGITVLPSLLPFFFLTLMLTGLGVINGFSKLLDKPTRFLYHAGGYSAVIQLISFISGYPVGAKLISELYIKGQISSKEATKISTFTSTSGPLFIIGSVGIAMFSNKTVGIIILISHLFSAILNGIIFRKYGDNASIQPLLPTKSQSTNLLYDCAYGATLSCLTVGTLIAVFSVFCQIAIDFKLLLPATNLFNLLFNDTNLSTAFITGLIECTNGCNMLSKSASFLSVPLASFVISFGGLCILVQSIAFLKEARVKIKIFLLAKIIQGLTAFAISALLCTIFL